MDRTEHLRRLVPQHKIPEVVERKLAKLWENPDFRALQERQMRYLLEFTDRADEVPTLAREFARFSITRLYQRWHPDPISNHRVEGIEWLTTKRDPERSVILSFMHHGWYEGLFVSVKRAGAPVTILALPSVMGSGAPTAMRQHIRVVRQENEMIPASGGVKEIQAQLRPGMTMAIAADVPGHTELKWLGRRVRGPIGHAVIAHRSNSPVVIATAHPTDGVGEVVRLHEPLEPGDFGEPMDLLEAILRRQEEAVLAWPEAFEMPRARWGIIEE